MTEREFRLTKDLEATTRELFNLKSILNPAPGQTINDRAREVMRYVNPTLSYTAARES